MRGRKMKLLKTLCCFSLSLALLLTAACSGGESGQPETTTEALSESVVNTVTVTIPEGTSASQIAELLEEKGVCSAQDFLSAVNNPENLSLISENIENADERAFLLEGYLFPDTYEFYLNSSGQSALKRFTDNLNAKLKPEYYDRARALGYTMDEIITIASIIQEEAGNPAEMNDVSSVIHNRLDSYDYPYIQCDVAIVYLERYVKPYFTEEEYEELTYNYNIVSKRRGLPAGAITNPGTAAIEAALYPSDTDYYYFVTDEDGNYYYANTYAGHRENCRKAGIKGY